MKNKEIKQPKYLSSIQLQCTPLKSIIYNNQLVTITDDYSYQTTTLSSTGELEYKKKSQIKPTITSITSSNHGILLHQHSQPIQLVTELQTKPIQSYQPFPQSNAILKSCHSHFYAFHSSTLFQYDYHYHLPSYQKRLKIGTVSSIDQYGWNSFLVCSTYQGKIGLLNHETFESIQSIDLQKEIVHIELFRENYLLVLTRKDDKMYVFDLRKFDVPIVLLSRSCLSNQRIGCCIKDDLLFTGNDNGFVYVYNLQTFQFENYYQLSCLFFICYYIYSYIIIF